jgi:hypothetical protein
MQNKIKYVFVNIYARVVHKFEFYGYIIVALIYTSEINFYHIQICFHH